MNVDTSKVSSAWRAAAHDLGIDVVAPFVMAVGGREHKFLALVPHFGGGRGIVVAALPSSTLMYADAKIADYRCSFVNVDLYSTYERAFFIETLAEWGFTGPQEKRPKWMTEVDAR